MVPLTAGMARGAGTAMTDEVGHCRCSSNIATLCRLRLAQAMSANARSDGILHPSNPLALGDRPHSLGEG